MYDVKRADWLYSTNSPITGPAWSGRYITYFTLHWPGDKNSYVGRSEQAILNAIQRDYQTNRGYSIGYSSAVGLSGKSYEVRGTTFRAASNGDTTHGDDLIPGNPKLQDNLEVFSCLLLYGMDDPITPAMIQGVRQLYSDLGMNLEINGHSDMDTTACPGPKAQLLIKQKAFYPKVEEEMQILDSPNRVFDTRFTDYTINGVVNKAGNPVGPGQFVFFIKTGQAVTQVEATVTAIPQKTEPGYLGVNKEDSFINWVASQKNVPIPQTVMLKVSNGGVSLYISDSVHLIFSIRAQ